MLTSPLEYCKTLAPQKISDVFDAPDLFIYDIRNELGLIGIRAIISLLISDVVHFFNVGKTMNDIQVAMTCDLIIDAYPYLKLEDLKLCFKNAMLLKYGKLYDRIDGAIIIGWLMGYTQERDEHAIMASDKAVERIESDLSDGVFYQDYLSNLKSRAELGDGEAKKYLEEHLSLQSMLKNYKSDKYFKDRERQRIYGRGNEYEKQYNRNLTKDNYRR